MTRIDVGFRIYFIYKAFSILYYVKGLTYSSRTIDSLVIQGYLNGKSRDQIAKETGISTGKVSNIIKEWKKGIDIPNVEELRDFAIEVKKSGISVGQCAQGYRMVQLMQNLGVADDGDTEVDNIGNNGNDGSGRGDGHGGNDGNQKYQLEFSTFVQEIYSNCKDLGIPAAIIPLWIKDLFSCYSHLDNSGSFIDERQRSSSSSSSRLKE